MNESSNPGISDATGREAQLAEEFPSLGHWTYVNHATVSPWPERVRQAVAWFANTNTQAGPERYSRWLENEQQLRERYARLISAGSAAEISLVPNTTEGVNIVASGLPWKAGDNLVTAKGEFPTNRMAWAVLEAQGVELREVDLAGVVDPEQALLNAMDERTRLLTVSAVQWDSGFRLKLRPLGEACRQAGVLFFVDAIQQLGALVIDVEAEAIDFLAAGGHKWQMGAEGVGLFYCRSALREQIEPLKHGWRMLEQPFAFNDTSRRVVEGGQRFEPGSPSTLGQFALNAALSLQEDYGQAWIESRILANTSALIDGIETIAGLELASNPAMERRSGIVSVYPGDIAAKALEQRLKKDRIIAIARGSALRLAPHFYQGKAVTDQVLNALEMHSKKD